MEKNKIAELLQEAMKDAVSKKEIQALVKQLLLFLKDFKAETAQNTAQHKDILRADLAKQHPDMFRMHGEMTRMKADVETKISAQVENITQFVRNEVKRLEEAIPESYDDSSLRKELRALKDVVSTIPPQFDPSGILTTNATILEKLGTIEKQIEELQRRPFGRGGGTSAAGVAQAFKYILKTEQPTGDIDGVNTTYTLSQPIYAILSMSINGEIIAQLPNYTIKGNTFTFSTALPADYSGKDWEVKYI